MSLMRPLVPLIERAVMGIDRALSRALQPRRSRGLLSLLCYCGWGSPSRVELTGRVVLPRTLQPAANADPRWRNFANILRRLLSREIGGVTVHGTLNGVQAQATSDADGFFTLLFADEAQPFAAGWHDAQLTIPGRERTSFARVQIVDDSVCAYGLISDLDDTVIQSDVTSMGRMLFTVLTGNARTRSPFPGVGSLYRALARHSVTDKAAGAADGTGSKRQIAKRQGRNPVFYVSSSPWNFFDLLWQFLEYRRIPLGPLFLRNWGADLMSGHSTYKHSVIERIFAAYPKLRFVLVGDSGEHDPEIYAEVAHKFPGRVLGIYIRDVNEGQGDERVLHLREDMARIGVDMVLARDSFAAAAHAMALGLITPGELRSVAQSVERSLNAPVLPF
ncbi:App1 family protein [Deinococcus altitudinis]|uniref:App1 family protein n=1 Tax=Deinococcus altitudinis TaxID=468914 RepID=UPI00389173D1